MKKNSEYTDLDDEVYELNGAKKKRKIIPQEKTRDLPNSTAFLVLGIVAISTCIFFIGIVIGGVVIKKCNDSLDFYAFSPEKYSALSHKQTLNARLLGYIALGFPILFFLSYTMITGNSPLDFFS